MNHEGVGEQKQVEVQGHACRCGTPGGLDGWRTAPNPAPALISAQRSVADQLLSPAVPRTVQYGSCAARK